MAKKGKRPDRSWHWPANTATNRTEDTWRSGNNWKSDSSWDWSAGHAWVSNENVPPNVPQATASTTNDALNNLTAQLVDLVEKTRCEELVAQVKRLESSEADLLCQLDMAENRLQDEQLQRAELQRQLDDSLVEKTALSERIESKDREVAALEASLARISSEQRMSSFKSCAEWQFNVGGNEWTSFPADRSEELQKHFEEYSKNNGPSLVRMKSGVEEYEFRLDALTQQNVKSRKTRPIRCTLNVPHHWTKSTSLKSIFQAETTESVDVRETAVTYMTGVYDKSNKQAADGSVYWWSRNGDAVIVGRNDMFFFYRMDSEYLSVRDGTFSDWTCSKNGGKLTDGGLWSYFMGKNCAFPLSPSIVSAPPSLPSAGALTNIVVEVDDNNVLSELLAVIRDSVSHHVAHNGPSDCDTFKQCVKLVRVLRVENWHLWRRYQMYAMEIKRDLVKHGISVPALDPTLPSVLVDYASKNCGGSLETSLNECLLFHGTSYDTAVKVALEGFDFRLSKPGYYGHGTYFASQACKSHMYTKENKKLHTLILSRVVLGDIHYAQKVDKDCRRPPMRAETSRCCDSVVAKPGPMPGHHRAEQTHQECVIFDKFQAYPELIIQYVLDV